MTSATRALAQERAPARSAPVAKTNLSYSLSFFILGIAVLFSALAVVYVSDLNRRLFINYQNLQTNQNQLYLNWGRLLLEQSTWSTQARIQNIAQQRLDMILPQPNQIVMIKE